MTPRGLIVIMAKEPVPGKVKTRLRPRLSSREAAQVYRNLLRDRLETVRRLPGLQKAVACSPPSSVGWFGGIVPKDFRVFPQHGEDLGSRLTAVAATALKKGHEAVSIIDSDSPDLPPELLMKSFRRLHSGADVVFGPSTDGGYYLVGVKREHPGLFEDIPWSTAGVLKASLAKADSLGLNTALLPPWRDIDTFEDLRAFYHRLRRREPGPSGPGRYTWACVEKLAAGGLRGLEGDSPSGSSP